MAIFEFASSKRFDVVGFGTNAVDFLIEVPAYPEFNSKIELSDYKQLAGGEAASTMAGLQRLGLSTAYAGRFGSDAAAHIGINSLVIEGVDTQFVERVPSATTQIAFIIVDERSGERTVIWKRDKKLAYCPEDAPVEAARQCKILHITPHDTAACIVMAEAAAAAGAYVSIDIDNLFDGIEELLPLVDIFVSSADLPGRLAGDMPLNDALSVLTARYGFKLACATLGEAGSLVLVGGEIIETKGFAVPGGCVDTTGAGDAFRAGLLYGLLTGRTISESAEYANAVAALKCRQIGARTALPDDKELFALLKNAGRE
ncbi:MAG: PfkB domain-containing protein [Acidobacteria bacterium OLB17]|nr:MAG: PfkB domain-containing protein [Acidobacteria bacterium OLB17]MCZ2390095.1 carbohydrate kinase family protein [Acidobacteriota bacterium]